MLQGSLIPPFCATFPAQIFGSISLCGGARSSCAQPQNMSRGKNIRSVVPASCHLPCELGSGELMDADVCAPARIEVNPRTASIQAHFFISPPKSRLPGYRTGTEYEHDSRLGELDRWSWLPGLTERNIVTCIAISSA